MTLVLERLSPALVTYTAGWSTTGHTFSHAPQPTHNSGSMCGRLTMTVGASAIWDEAASAGRAGTATSSVQIALGEVGQNSSQTMHGVAMAQGKQRPRSYIAVPTRTGFWPIPILAGSVIF